VCDPPITQDDPDPPHINEDVSKEVIASYYPQLVSAADSARSRAQGAYAIANALAGGLVGASLLTLFANAATWSKIVGFAAVGVWIMASGLYIRAVASQLPPEKRELLKSKDAFVDHVLNAASDNRKIIDFRQSLANKASVIAIMFTAVAFALLLFGPAATFKGTVNLTATAAQSLSQTCGHTITEISGQVVTSSVSASMMTVEIPPNECAGATNIDIPSSSVSSIIRP
jgi:hypothetical protein